MSWWIISGVIIFVTILAAVESYRDRIVKKEYLDKHPPLSDEEFVRRCGDNVPPEVALKVRRTFSETSGMDYEHIYPDTRLFEDLKLG
ncbi:hypothetical protein [Rubinisphaera italica]|uniref:Uncharacterized protein n=1 Tax=Rubinisphaera italica TaxID=2527969 RepID=A0A5C5XPQ3_9PLAN|nr:hypothetical protein [Rubinisphaera italica]TWT64451.1 hypothetical protein Pan54_52150 [Rubinisphaera italica]